MSSLSLFVSLLPHSLLLFFLYSAIEAKKVQYGFICVTVD